MDLGFASLLYPMAVPAAYRRSFDMPVDVHPVAQEHCVDCLQHRRHCAVVGAEL